MKYSIIIALLTLAASCGNPHISSTGPGLETTTPPATPGEGDGSGETAGTTAGATSGTTTGTTPGPTPTNETTSGQTTVGRTTSGTTAGQTTAGQTTAGQTTAGQTTAGQTTAGQTTAGQTTAGQTTAGQTTAGQTTAGQTTAGQTTAGQTTAGQATAGQATAGQTNAGSTGGTTSGGGTGCIPSSREIRDINFYFGDRAAGRSRENPAEFSELIRCRTAITETFNNLGNGNTQLISNQDNQGLGYVLVHQIEKSRITGRDNFLEDFFGTQTFSMEIEEPVSQNGVEGIDRGVDSHSANNQSKDALIWSFSSPISFWGANVVDVESGPGEPAVLRLFDCNKSLIRSSRVNYPNNEQGQKELHFIGFVSARAEVCHVSLTVGDYKRPGSSRSKAFYRALAVDEFTYGK